MKTQKYFPATGFNSLLDEFFGRDLLETTEKGTIPRVNIIENDADFVIEIASPGLEKKDFSISLDNNILIIKTEKKEEEKTIKKEGKVISKGFNYSSFERSFTLPDSVDMDKISAKYEKGIMKIVMLKKEEAKVLPQEIKIS